MPEMNRKVLLKRRPNGMPMPEDFAIVEGPLLEPGDGQVLLSGIYLSLDPYMRGRVSGQRSYATPTKIDDVIEGRVVGQVMRSRHPSFREGDFASGGYGWQTHSVVHGDSADKARSRAGTAFNVAWRPRHAGSYGVCRPQDHRPAQGGRDGCRLRRIRGCRGRVRTTGQARRLPRCRNCRRHRQVPLRY